VTGAIVKTNPDLGVLVIVVCMAAHGNQHHRVDDQGQDRRCGAKGRELTDLERWIAARERSEPVSNSGTIRKLRKARMTFGN
jgi:hypothetical protein